MRFRLLLLVHLFATVPTLVRAQDLERPPVPDYLKVAINESLERGKSYLMRSQKETTGTWAPGDGNGVGYAALPGLALLELGVSPKDPVIQRAAFYIKSKAAKLDGTYEVALAVLFLDRLGDPKDKIFIEALCARLIAGQTHTGGWSYKLPVLDQKDSDLILKLIRAIEPLPLQELLGGRLDRLNNPFVKNFPSKNKIEAKEAKKRTVKIPPNLVDLPVLNEFSRFQALEKLFDPADKGSSPTFGTTDNSTTQFGLLALWAGRRKPWNIPASRTGTLAFMRYHVSQNSDGSWGYPFLQGGGTSSHTMINPGLLGMAIGHGLVREMELIDEPPVDEDPRIHRAFLALSQHIGTPQDRVKDLPMPNLYFIWSVERVAVLYNMHLIGGKDWYRWGAEALIANHNPETGTWDKGNFPGGDDPTSGPLNAAFALLFLKRANLAQDLSAFLTFSSKRLNDSVVKIAPPPPPKPEPKVVETKKEEPKPVVVAEAKPMPPPTPEPKVEQKPTVPPANMMPQPPPPSAQAPPASGGTAWWVWLLVGLGGVLIVGGILAVVFLSGGGGGDEDDDEPRAKKKKKPKNK